MNPIYRGLDREPTGHEGPDVREMEARGIPTQRGEWNRAVLARNAERDRRDEAEREARRREEERRRDPVERRAEAWRGAGLDAEDARAVASLERSRGREFGGYREALEAIAPLRSALNEERVGLWRERREHEGLERAARERDRAAEVEGSSSVWRRLLDGDARREYERAVRDAGFYGRELERAGVRDPGELARRGEELRAREVAYRDRQRGFEPYERAYGGLLRAEGREREEQLQREREREWGRRDRERGDPPGTARARDEADRDDWCP